MPAFTSQFGLLSLLLTDLAAVLAPFTVLADHTAAGRVRAFLRGVGHSGLLSAQATQTCRRSSSSTATTILICAEPIFLDRILRLIRRRPCRARQPRRRACRHNRRERWTVPQVGAAIGRTVVVAGEAQRRRDRDESALCGEIISARRARSTRRRDAHTVLDGTFLAWANPPADASQGGDYPFAFDCPDAATHEGLSLPAR